jgi:NodT family efflux transporter outer membrane factor (OMF) lipoprotein
VAALACGLVLGSVACTSGAPERPLAAPLAVPARWQAAPEATESRTPATALTRWWQRFDDPELTRWAALAQQGSPRATAARAAWQQALARRDAAAAALAPTLAATASAGRDTSGNGSSRRSDERVQLGLEARWVPDVNGSAAQALAAADALAAARHASLGDVQVQLAGEAALAYIGLRAQQARLRLARDTLASQRQTLQITLWREQAGLVSGLQREQARAAAAQTEALLPALQAAIAQARHTLSQLAGRPYEAVAAVAGDDDTPVPEAADDLALDIPAETLRQRADVRAAELDVEAALSRVSEAQAQRGPSFSLGGSIGLRALTLGALGDGASLVSSLLAGVSLPIFDGGARRAQVRGQQAALEEAQARHHATVLAALKEVEDALVTLAAIRARGLALATAAAAAAQADRLARQRYDSGLVDFQTVLDTQRTAFSAQDAVVGARADLARAHVQLALALGGGWQGTPQLAALEATP